MMLKFAVTIVVAAVVAISDISALDAVLFAVRSLLWLVKQQDAIEFMGAMAVVSGLINLLTGDE